MTCQTISIVSKWGMFPDFNPIMMDDYERMLCV